MITPVWFKLAPPHPALSPAGGEDKDGGATHNLPLSPGGGEDKGEGYTDGGAIEGGGR